MATGSFWVGFTVRGAVRQALFYCNLEYSESKHLTYSTFVVRGKPEDLARYIKWHNQLVGS